MTDSPLTAPIVVGQRIEVHSTGEFTPQSRTLTIANVTPPVKVTRTRLHPDCDATWRTEDQYMSADGTRYAQHRCVGGTHHGPHTCRYCGKSRNRYDD